MKKADPQHADTPSLLAIREATASIFADLNSNLESIKNFDSKSTPEKEKKHVDIINDSIIPSIPPPPEMEEDEPIAPPLNRQTPAVNESENTIGTTIYSPAPVNATINNANLVVQTAPQAQQLQVPAQPQQPVKQKKPAKRRGTNAHLLLKKSLQAAVPAVKDLQKKPKKKVRNHLAHLAKVEAVFTEDLNDLNSPSVFDGKPPAQSSQKNETVSKQIQQPPQHQQQQYGTQDYYNQQGYYEQQQYYQQQTSQYEPNSQQQQYAGQVLIKRRLE